MNTRTRIEGFTVLRGVAILFIIFYHFLPHKVFGGFLGVDIFLVLSGYLTHRSFTEALKEHRAPKFIPFFV